MQGTFLWKRKLRATICCRRAKATRKITNAHYNWHSANTTMSGRKHNRNSTAE